MIVDTTLDELLKVFHQLEVGKSFRRRRRRLLSVDVPPIGRSIDNLFGEGLVGGQGKDVEAVSPVLEVFRQQILLVTSGANVIVHVVPIEVFQSFRLKLDPGDFVGVIVRCYERDVYSLQNYRDNY